MKTTVYLSDFRDAFRSYNRQDNFSYEGLEALFNYIEELEQDTGEEMELDIVALCCDFTEWESPLECAENYSSGWADRLSDEDDDSAEEEFLDYLRDYTTVIEIPGTSALIVQDF